MSGLTDDAPPLALSEAGDEDHDEIVALANAAFRGEGGWNAETGLIAGARTTLGLLREDLARPGARLLIHRDRSDGSLLATVRLVPGEGGAWHLGLLAVRPDLQARGLGRTVLAAAEAYARARGALRIRMGVIDARDTLIAWYERRGYARTGESEAFPYGDERFGRPLRDDLHFVVLEKRL
jgi:ribosomal protein S18 acetylase RimI-like enzyme